MVASPLPRVEEEAADGHSMVSQCGCCSPTASGVLTKGMLMRGLFGLLLHDMNGNWRLARAS